MRLLPYLTQSLLDFGKAPYQFEDNGKLSYYIDVKAKNGQPKLLWGTEYQEQIQALNIRNGDIVRLNGSKIERAEEISHKAKKGIKFKKSRLNRFKLRFLLMPCGC